MKILKFYSESCGPCKVMDMNLRKAGIDFMPIEVNDEANQEYLDKYNVHGIPTIIKIDDECNVIDSFTGVMNMEQLKHWCNENS